MSTAPPEVRRRRLGFTLALLAFAQFIIALDNNIVYVALPEIGKALHFSDYTLQWVVSAYAVAFGGCLLLGGRASDLGGPPRRMFILGMALFAGASLAGGLAQGPLLLIAARAVQGIGGAVLFPASLSLINTTFAEGPERNRALAVWSVVSVGGLALGSLAGGLLTSGFGWPAVFLVNVPLAVGGALLPFVLIPKDTPGDKTRSFDMGGALTATIGVTLMVFSLVQGPELGWTSPTILISIVLAVVLIAAFFRVEQRCLDPLMPLRLLKHRSLTTAMGLTAIWMGTFGVQCYFLTLYFQNVLGYSALQTGLAFLAPVATTTAGIMVGERVIERVGLRVTLIVGLAAGAVGMAMLAFDLSQEYSYVAMLPAVGVLSIGQGFSWPAMWIAAGSGVASSEQGIASGMASTTQQIGGAVGLAVLVALATPEGHAEPSVLADGLAFSVYVTAAIALLGILLVFGIERHRKQPTTPDPVVLKEAAAREPA